MCIFKLLCIKLVLRHTSKKTASEMFNLFVLFFLVLEVLCNFLTSSGSYGTMSTVYLIYPTLTTASVACGRLAFCSVNASLCSPYGQKQQFVLSWTGAPVCCVALDTWQVSGVFREAKCLKYFLPRKPGSEFCILSYRLMC